MKFLTLALALFSVNAQAGIEFCDKHPIPRSVDLCRQAYNHVLSETRSHAQAEAAVRSCRVYMGQPFLKGPFSIPRCLLNLMGQDE